ncbi:MAG: tetratricopeptide repeat protein, partial [Candidatus Anammoxibacter sp.]
KDEAQKRNVEAQYHLAVKYYYGRGVAQDYKKAVYWYRKAAEQGDAMAQNSLGEMYESGLGVERNYVEAYKWILLAENNGFGIYDTSSYREVLEKNMTEEQITAAQRLVKAFVPK